MFPFSHVCSNSTDASCYTRHLSRGYFGPASAGGAEGPQGREDLRGDSTVESGGLLTRGAYNVMPRRISFRGLYGHRLPLAALLEIRSSLGLSLCSCPCLARGPALLPPSGSSLGRFVWLIGHSLHPAAAAAQAPEEFHRMGSGAASPHHAVHTPCCCSRSSLSDPDPSANPLQPANPAGEDGSSASKLGYAIESGRSLSSTRSFAYSTPTTSELWEALILSSLQRLRDPLRTTTCSKYR